MAPWTLVQSDEVTRSLGAEDGHWAWEFERSTPAGIIAHKFTWKVNEFGSDESFRNVGKRALCLMLIACAPDEVVDDLVKQIGHFWTTQTTGLLGEPEVDDQILMNQGSVRLLKSIIASRSLRSSPSAWSDEEVQEP